MAAIDVMMPVKNGLPFLPEAIDSIRNQSFADWRLLVLDHGSTDGEIFNNIKNGVAPDFNMIPWKDKLKDPDVWNVVNYLRSIAKKK